MANRSIRHGVSLRKRYNAVAADKRASYMCDVCGKQAVRRISTGIWQCRHCGATYAGGAYTMRTEAGAAAVKAIGQTNGAQRQV